MGEGYDQERRSLEMSLVIFCHALPFTQSDGRAQRELEIQMTILSLTLVVLTRYITACTAGNKMHCVKWNFATIKPLECDRCDEGHSCQQGLIVAWAAVLHPV